MLEIRLLWIGLWWIFSYAKRSSFWYIT